MIERLSVQVYHMQHPASQPLGLLRNAHHNLKSVSRYTLNGPTPPKKLKSLYTHGHACYTVGTLYVICSYPWQFTGHYTRHTRQMNYLQMYNKKCPAQQFAIELYDHVPPYVVVTTTIKFSGGREKHNGSTQSIDTKP